MADIEKAFEISDDSLENVSGGAEEGKRINQIILQPPLINEEHNEENIREYLENLKRDYTT